MSEPVLLASEDGVARITLNRPGKRNAFDRPMWHALREAVATAAGDPAHGCLLLTAAGESFSAGADIAEFFDCRRNSAEAAAYGEAMDAAEVAEFEARADCADLVALRTADDAAKVIGVDVGDLDRWRPALAALAQTSFL